MDAIWETIPYKVEADNIGQQVAEERLESLSRLFQVSPAVASERLVRLAAEATNDTPNPNVDSIKRIESFAREKGVPISCHFKNEDSKSHGQDFRAHQEAKSPDFQNWLRIPLFPFKPSFVDILAGIRRIENSRGSLTEQEISGLAVFLSYCLDEMASVDGEASARRILHFFARETKLSFLSQKHPLGEVGRYFETQEEKLSQQLPTP